MFYCAKSLVYGTMKIYTMYMSTPLLRDLLVQQREINAAFLYLSNYIELHKILGEIMGVFFCNWESLLCSIERWGRVCLNVRK